MRSSLASELRELLKDERVGQLSENCRSAEEVFAPSAEGFDPGRTQLLALRADDRDHGTACLAIFKLASTCVFSSPACIS